MKKGIIGLIILIILVVGGILIFHKSPAPQANNGSNNSTGQAAASNAVVLTKTSSSLGQYLTDPSGRALYTYNADSAGVSNCTGSCLAAWPAYLATATMANLPSGISTITRTDNHQSQYAYNGMPLYYFASDSGNQVTGNGVENFSVAKPSGAASSNSSNTASPSPSSSSGSSY